MPQKLQTEKPQPCSCGSVSAAEGPKLKLSLDRKVEVGFGVLSSGPIIANRVRQTTDTGAPITIEPTVANLNVGGSSRPNRIREGRVAAAAAPGKKGVDFPWYELTAFLNRANFVTTQEMTRFDGLTGGLLSQVGGVGRGGGPRVFQYAIEYRF